MAIPEPARAAAAGAGGDGSGTLSWREVSLYFLVLGFINIGGPVAQITMMYNHMVERRGWLSKERFVRILAFCHMLPGPEALQLAIYVGYVKKKAWGGVLAGLTFIAPGAAIITLLSWLYVDYGRLPRVDATLEILKPVVLGIICAGILKLGRASVRNAFLGFLVCGSFAAIYWERLPLLAVLLAAGTLNLLVSVRPNAGWRQGAGVMLVFGLAPLGPAASRWLQMAGLFLQTGLFSFGGAYASLAFLQRGAVEQHHWLTDAQLVDGVAISLATPGPFMLFATFTGYLTGGLQGAILATCCVFLPSFVFVLAGARYIETLRDNRFLQAFLSGASAAVVGVIAVVTLGLIPQSVTGPAALVLAVTSFLCVAVLKVDAARIAAIGLAAGMAYAGVTG